MSLYICPVCRKPLQKGEKFYICSQNHSYDIASSGYVNLLLANRKHSAYPEDDKWNTPQDEVARLKGLNKLVTQIAFNIHVYKKHR